MAHEIEAAGDFGYNAAGGKPWHVGMTGCQPFPGGGPVTAHEAQKLILPWNVEESPLTPVGCSVIVPDAKGLIRHDTRKYLGTVGIKRHTLQNVDVADIIRNVFGDLPIIETCGALRGGERTFFLVRLATPLVVTPGDEIQRYFLVYNPHDGTGSVRLRIVNIRVVCANTLRIALVEDTKEITVRHNEAVKLATETGMKLLAAEEVDRAATATFLAACRERQMSKEEWKGLLDVTTPIPAPKADAKRDNQGRANNRRAFLSALFFDGTAPLTRKNDEGKDVTVVHNLDGADTDGGQTAYRALQVMSQDADRSRSVHKGTDRKVQNLFGEGSGAENVEATVGYLKTLVGASN